MANANYTQTSIPYVKETVPGTTPSSPDMLLIRTTNPLGIQPSKTLLEPEEVLSHRSEEHTRHGVEQIGGSIPFERSWGAYRDWLEALLCGSWDEGVLKSGTNVQTFTVEQRLAIDRFIRYTGVTPSQLQLTMNPTGLITGSFDVLGMGFEAETTALGAPDYVEREAPYDGLGNAVITEGGDAIGVATSINLTINNNASLGAVLGSAQSDVPTYGTLQVTGTMTARFNDLSLFNKFKNETESSLQVVLNNLGGDKTTAFIIPRLKYVSGQPQNNDNVIDGAFEFRGLYDQSEGSSIIIEEQETT